jgi:hypothetical protein
VNRVITTSADPGGAVNTMTTATDRTRRLLACGILAGPLFVGMALAQAFTRPGFDFERHALSLLSLGDLGWIQVANFLVSGLLTVLFAVGLRKALNHGRAGTWGPALVAIYGAGTFAAGLFSTDPSVGFPPGAPAGLPESLSWHAILHGVSFFVAFASLVAACFVFASRFRERKQWRRTAYCVLSGIVAPALRSTAGTALVAPLPICTLQGLAASHGPAFWSRVGSTSAAPVTTGGVVSEP